jgi:hypothetical protein
LRPQLGIRTQVAASSVRTFVGVRVFGSQD